MFLTLFLSQFLSRRKQSKHAHVCLHCYTPCTEREFSRCAKCRVATYCKTYANFESGYCYRLEGSERVCYSFFGYVLVSAKQTTVSIWDFPSSFSHFRECQAANWPHHKKICIRRKPLSVALPTHPDYPDASASNMDMPD